LGQGAKAVVPLIEAILYDVKEDATIGDQIEAISQNIESGLFVDEVRQLIPHFAKILSD
jgi:hypothetical protein